MGGEGRLSARISKDAHSGWIVNMGIIFWEGGGLTAVHGAEPVSGCDVGEVASGEVAVGLQAELLSEAGVLLASDFVGLEYMLWIGLGFGHSVFLLT